MKKFLLSLAACAMLVFSADAMYIIGDPAGGWSPQVGAEMEEVDGGWKWSGTVGVDQYFAFATQLLDSDDWATFNAGYRLSPDSGDGTVAASGVHGMHIGSPDGAFRGNGAEVTYLVKKVDDTYSLEVTVKGDEPEQPKDKWSVIGAFNEWNDDFWMTEVQPGVWKATMYDFSGEFKFRANGDWAVNYGAADAESAVLEADGSFGIARDGINFNIPEPVEEVVLYLDLNNQVLNVEGLSPKFLALRGSFVDWNFEWSYLFQEIDDDVYMLYLDGVEADWEFKIANQDWTEEYTTAITDMTAGEMYELKPGAGLGNMGVDKNYTEVSMFFMIDEGMFWFTGEVADSVAQNEIAAGKARYFNLQGAEVVNPVEGIYIRVINGKSEKIIVK